jgi:high-affinity iron transporter
MLLDAIITVLRETLEAGVLVSVLAAFGMRLQLSLRWLGLAFGIGLSGALAYALALRGISEWFNGVGQEATNAATLYAIYLALLGVLATARIAGAPLRVFMTAAVALAVTREGAEIMLFFSSYLQSEEAMMRALTSGFVGMMIGFCVGVLSYYTLAVMLPPVTAHRVQLLVLLLIAAGMALQGTQLLIQADWLPAGMPLWDTSRPLSEHSISGQMAYAVFGYESTPTAVEMSAYAGALVLLLISQWLSARRRG